jgi:hypothetical protein
MCCINDQNQFLRFKHLRVLEVVECSFNTEGPCYLERLGDLLHLRYLRTERCGGCVPALPKQIENLKLLQTLDVDGGLPASIGQLTKLVRLWAGQSNAPDGIGNLTSLEDLRIRLRGDPMTKRFMKELGSLGELRLLRFSTDGMDERTQILLWSPYAVSKNSNRYMSKVLFQKPIQPCGRQQALCSHSLSLIWICSLTSLSYRHA